MDYSPEAMDALYGEVERQGGAWSPDVCQSTPVSYKSPPYKKNRKPTETCSCGHETMCVVTYEPDEDFHQSGSGFVRMCAVCDHVGVMPRFCDPVFEADPEMDVMYWERFEQEDEDAEG